MTSEIRAIQHKLPNGELIASYADGRETVAWVLDEGAFLRRVTCTRYDGSGEVNFADALNTGVDDVFDICVEGGA